MKDPKKHDTSDRSDDDVAPGVKKPPISNPPRTTTGKWTAPKFGSAGSGGAELEPGPERD